MTQNIIVQRQRSETKENRAYTKLITLENQMSFSINFIDEDYDDDRAQEISCWLEDVSDEFIKSSFYQQLSEHEKEDCFFLLSILFDYAYSYCLVGPGKLDTAVLSELMLDVIPRKVAAEKQTFESFANVFNNFMFWCVEKKYIQSAAEICQFVTDNSDKMVKTSQIQSKWGLAKSLAMGRGISDIETLPTVINTSITVKRDKPKIGRNDNCACESGKKYKKCCMLTAIGQGF